MPSAIELGAPDRKNGDLTATGDSNELLSLLKDQINNFPPGKQYSIAIKEVPVTVERLPYYPKDGDRLQDPGTARVNIAASNESPNGTIQDNWAEEHKHQTVRLDLGVKYNVIQDCQCYLRSYNNTSSTGTRTKMVSSGLWILIEAAVPGVGTQSCA